MLQTKRKINQFVIGIVLLSVLVCACKNKHQHEFTLVKADLPIEGGKMSVSQRDYTYAQQNHTSLRFLLQLDSGQLNTMQEMHVAYAFPDEAFLLLDQDTIRTHAKNFIPMPYADKKYIEMDFVLPNDKSFTTKEVLINDTVFGLQNQIITLK
jgi:hypothetical protein